MSALKRFLYICSMGYTKAEYIERFGEDYYYNVVVPANRARNAKYIKTEKGKATRKKYAQSPKSKEYMHNRYLENKEYAIEKAYKWVEEHKEERRDYQKNYMQDWRKTKKGRANSLLCQYNAADEKRGFSVDQNIDQDWVIKNVFSGQKCIYCGDDDWRHLGVDRIDNSKPHTPDNCVCACGLCNFERADKYSVEEFIEYRKLYPRILGNGIEKSWEIVEQNGVRVIKKKN